jgi:hypothetical protein
LEQTKRERGQEIKHDTGKSIEQHSKMDKRNLPEPGNAVSERSIALLRACSALDRAPNLLR